MSVGTMSINGVQVAEVESFEFTPIVDESSVSSVPMLSPGVYHSIVLPVSIRNEAMSKPLRPCPKGRWVGGRKGDPDDIFYVVRGRRVGLVCGSSAAVVPLGGLITNLKQGRRRCESKRWVERTYAEAWYREEMCRRWVFAMGFRVEGNASIDRFAVMGGQDG